MKQQDIKALHQKSEKELMEMLDQMSRDLAVLQLKKKSYKLDNYSKVKLMKDDVARIKTVLTHLRNK